VLRVAPSIENKYSRSRLVGGELLVTLVGTMGLSAIASSDLRGWNVARAVGVVPLRDGVDKRWVNFVVRSAPSQEFINTHANTTVQATFNLKDLARLPVPLPPDEIRTNISELLSALDDKIELNRQTNETLEALARAIFKDWFVDCGPTRAKAEGRPPYLAPELWDLFPDALDDEDKPVGWSFSEIGDICIIKSGQRPPEKADEPDLINKYPVYGGNGISWYTTDTLYEPPFVITGRVGTLGTVFRVYEKAWVSDNALCCFPKEPEYLGLIYFLLRQLDFASLNSGSTQPLLTQTTLKSQKVVFGDEQIVSAFAKITDLLFTKLEQNKSENLTLAETRDLLLPKLMSGEIRLREAEKLVEAVA